MKAAIYTRYGPPDVVQITDAEKPSPKDSEVLIRVHAASVNPLDWHFMRGTPYLVRIHSRAAPSQGPPARRGRRRPGRSGGRSVTRFQAGDAVFGACRGAFAGSSR